MPLVRLYFSLTRFATKKALLLATVSASVNPRDIMSKASIPFLISSPIQAKSSKNSKFFAVAQ